MIGVLENPTNPASELTTKDVMAAASVLGLKVHILKAEADSEIDAAFASLVQARAGALFVSGDLLFNNRIEQLVALAARHAIPTIYLFREFVVAGGLISYGANLSETYRQIGAHCGDRVRESAVPKGVSHASARPPESQCSFCRQQIGSPQAL